MEKSVYASILEETEQAFATRKRIFKDLEKRLGRRVISLFTSFSQPVSLSDSDADMLQDLLQRMDLSNGITIIISSLGGYGLAAERIVNVCRAFSGGGDYEVMIPAKAKSAATIICMGASKLYMGPSSELGPIDPQIIRRESGSLRVWSAYDLVNSYDKMFKKATRARNENLEPYLQQLSRYDERDIETWRSQIALSEDIAIKTLKTGMLKTYSQRRIRDSIGVFLNPKAGTKSHARPIYRDQARQCGLNVEDLDVKDKLWKSIYELYMRTDHFVSVKASKAIESSEGGFFAPKQSIEEAGEEQSQK